MSAPRLLKADKEGILKAYERGDPPAMIAARFGVDVSYPRLLAKRRGLTLRGSRANVGVRSDCEKDRACRTTPSGAD